MRLVGALLSVAVAGAVALTTATTVQAEAAAGPSTVVAVHHDALQQDALQQLSQQDRTYLQKSHQDNLATILAGLVAQAKAYCPAVHRIGATLVTKHSRADADVRAVASRYGVPLPATPTAQQMAEIEAVAAKSGAEFDRAWLRMEITAHTDALQLSRHEQQFGRSWEVKRLASAAEQMILHHLTMLAAALTGCGR